MTTEPHMRYNACMKHPNESVIFRQLVDNATYTYTYILADLKSREAVIIDPVYEKVERDVELINQLELKLKYALNTHVHADHITGSGRIKSFMPNVKSVISEASKAVADIHIKDGDKIQFGNEFLHVLGTPGHTNGCLTFVSHTAKIAFTGDALLIRGCGRTDFQQGNSEVLYDSIHKKILSLPDEYSVFPGHDYMGRTSSSIGEEKRFNPRLTQNKEDFIETMKNLNLVYPRLMDVAVPANMVCGLQEPVKKNDENK
ncbi:unnamed protein product [Brachionus calyciflorus]|uniref:Persulfide dioxygenase ETHE1, mitochondrial n=1 Tax=Brachionus calyciflorus TaxID=104777 RepID=A0A814GFN0_9BILA|nr:unnamed protein product [Brachionus calyciflorus]